MLTTGILKVLSARQPRESTLKRGWFWWASPPVRGDVQLLDLVLFG